MTTTPTTIECLSDRLDGLQRENRRLRWVAVALVVGAVVLVVETRARLAAPPGVIEAEKIVIKDHEGRIRAQFGLDRGEPGLVLRDGRGQEQVSLSVAGPDWSALTFADHGQTRLLLDAAPDGGARFRLFDRDQKSASAFFMAPDSTTGLNFANGRHGLAMGLQPNGQSAIVSTDPEGRENGRLGAAAVDPRRLGLNPRSMVTSTTVPATESAIDPNANPSNPMTATEEPGAISDRSSYHGASN